MSLWSDDHIQPEKYKGIFGFFRWLAYITILAAVLVLYLTVIVSLTIFLFNALFL